MAGLMDVRQRQESDVDRAGWDGLVAEVFEQHRERLVGFFVRRTGDRDLAEDLAHETLVRFAGAEDHFDRDRPVWPYLRRVAANLLADVSRGDHRVVAMDIEAVYAEEPAAGQPLEDTVVLGSLLEAAMDGLSQWQRVAFELRCERGWDMADSAAFLGLSSNAFRQLLFRARRNLREALEKSGAVVPGLVVPALVGLREWLRSAGARVRESVQGSAPSVALSAEGLASMVVATTIGVAVAVGAPASGAEGKVASSLPAASTDTVSDDVAVSTAPAPDAGGVAVEAAPPVTPSTADAPATAPEAAPPAGRTTVVEAPDAVPDSDGHVEMGEDDEEFVLSREVAAKTGDESLESEGKVVAIHCGSPEGEVLCGMSDS